jgi:predicted RNA-binding protein with PUA domain
LRVICVVYVCVLCNVRVIGAVCVVCKMFNVYAYNVWCM